MAASFPFSRAMTANQSGLDPLANWQYRQAPWPCRVTIMLRATTAAVVAQIWSGAAMVQQESPVQGGGTAGVTPAPLNTPPITFDAPAGDFISIQLRETAGGTPTVDGIVYIDRLF